MKYEMKVFPVRPPNIPFEKWAKAHGGYGWHSEGGRMTVDGPKLVINTADGQHGEYVFDYKVGAYKRAR